MRHLLRDVWRDQGIRTLAWALLGVLFMHYLYGCGGGAVQTSARAATVSAVVVQGAARVIGDSAAADFAATCPASEYPTQVAAAECAVPVRARWAPADAAVGVLRATLSQWVETTRTAHLAGEDGALWGALAMQAARLVADYEALRLAVYPLGVELPAMPALVVDLAESVGGGR